MTGGALVVGPEPFGSPEATFLVGQAVAELRRRYGVTDEDLGYRVPVAGDFAAPLGGFWVARWDGVPVGCVGLRPLPPGAEVKRLYVEAGFRGRGVGRRLMDELEQAAWAAGHRVLCLETGARQPEAIALYQATGWRRTEGWSEAPIHRGSVYFEKELGPPDGS